MSWVRLAEGFMRNRKIIPLTDGEFRVWVRLLCYCGEVEDPTVDQKTRLEVAGLTRKRVVRFAESGLLDAPKSESSNDPGRTLGDDIYEVHDWVQYQPKDATSAERKRRWRAKRDVTNGVPGTVPATVPPSVPGHDDNPFPGTADLSRAGAQTITKEQKLSLSKAVAREEGLAKLRAMEEQIGREMPQ